MGDLSFQRFRLTILAGFVALVAAVLAVTLAVIDRIQTRQAEEMLTWQLKISRDLVALHLRRSCQQLQDGSRLMISDPSFARGGSAFLQSKIGELRDVSGAEGVWVLGRGGEVLSGTIAEPSFGPGSAAARALAGADADGIEEVRGRLFHMTAVPAPGGGAVVAGYAFSDHMAQQVKRASGADVTFIKDGRIVASTLPLALQASLRGRLGALPAGRIGSVDFTGGRHLGMVTRPAEGLETFVHGPVLKAMGAEGTLKPLLVLMILGLTAAGGIFVSRLVSREMEALVVTIRRQNARLSELDRLKDELVWSVSHDLKGPINAMVMLSQAMLDGTYGPVLDPQRRKLALIQDSGRRLIGFVNNILDTAKIKAGRLELRRRPVPCAPIVGRVMELFDESAASRAIALESRVAASLGALDADPEKLEQVLVSLVGRSVKLARPGSRVGVEVRAAQGQAEFRVVGDLGGPAPRRGADPTGDALCRAVVDSHGGRIWPEAEGRATGFTIPLADPAQSPASAGDAKTRVLV